MTFFNSPWRILVVLGLITLSIGSAIFFSFLKPVEKNDLSLREITIEKGDGLQKIANTLKQRDLIRSSATFKILAVVTLRAHLLKSGSYFFLRSMSTAEIINKLVGGEREEVTVVIPEGWNTKDIDALLNKEKVIHGGELIKLVRDKKLEGYLFPDTYRFYRDSDAAVVLEKFLDNFKKRTALLLGGREDAYQIIILASLIEKEVPDSKERNIVAGILEKRLRAGWPLQVDATICYLKPGKCYPLNPLDFKIDSPYNTYLRNGLPVAPIANPGLDAILAALHPKDSDYWYYLSDPKTQKTFFAKTLEEQSKNKAKVLR